MKAILMLTGLVYVILLISGFSKDPRKKYYHKILIPFPFLLHLACAAAFAGVCWHLYHSLFLFSAPVVALVSLYAINLFMQRKHGRNVYLITRFSKKPADSLGEEGLAVVILWLVSILGPLIADSKFL